MKNKKRRKALRSSLYKEIIAYLAKQTPQSTVSPAEGICDKCNCTIYERVARDILHILQLI
jgi:hypothetical protein